MEPPRRRIRSDSGERTAPPFKPGALSRGRAKLEAFHLRDVWWRILDFFEASRGRRIALYCTGVLLIAGVAARIWVYPWWTERSAIRVAQQWLEAGQYRNAAEAAERASRVAPTRPEPWRIAAELASIGGQRDKALQYARRAAELAPEDPVFGIAWAAAALNADDIPEAKAALAKQPAESLASSPEARRIQGEIARRESRLTEARDHFEAALQLGGSQPINEVPLGLILLRSTVPAERQRGLALLEKWAGDPSWGATALRILLDDALARGDQPAMRRWADALRQHPRITVGDMPVWLLALWQTDPARYATALAELEKDHAVTPAAAAQLLGWLNQIGRSADAVAWLKTLPGPAMRRTPLAALAAEAFRAHGQWDDLQAWTDAPPWDADTEFLRWTYGLTAALKREDSVRADELWRTLYNHGQLNTGHALFAASTLYTWGITDKAVELWWRAAQQEGSNAIEALGALARHYQVNRDAEGLYRAFRRLHSLQPQDAAIANNFAFYALLLGREQRVAAQVARANREQYPDDLNYLATQAFSLTQQGRVADALSLLRPKASLAASAPGIAFAYGMALAANGQKSEARPILDRLPPATLTTAEVELIKQTLGP
jgi:tetratricopeptide (TPR) repeat protein